MVRVLMANAAGLHWIEEADRHGIIARCVR